ncbi:hypothetical protein D3C84_1239160 [compost metagenome]
MLASPRTSPTPHSSEPCGRKKMSAPALVAMFTIFALALASRKAYPIADTSAMIRNDPVPGPIRPS